MHGPEHERGAWWRDAIQLAIVIGALLLGLSLAMSAFLDAHLQHMRSLAP